MEIPSLIKSPATLILVGAIIAAIGAFWQQHKSNKAQEELTKQIHTLVSSAVAPTNSDKLENVHADLSDRFDRIEKAISSLGAKLPPKTETQASTQPSVVQHIQMSQKRVPSTREDAPYGLQIILQTDVQQQPTAFIVECDGEITDGKFFMAGQPVMMGVGYGVQVDKRKFYLSVQSPPFTPQSPIVITLLSKTDIKVTKVVRVQQ